MGVAVANGAPLQLQLGSSVPLQLWCLKTRMHPWLELLGPVRAVLSPVSRFDA